MITGLVPIIVMIQIMILSALAIVKEKEYGTIEQLVVSPIRPYELLIGKILPFVLIGYIQITLVLLASIYWFRVPFKGDFFLTYLLLTLFFLPILGFGIFISQTSKNQYQAMITSFFVIYPSVLIGGFLFPISNMPKAIQYITTIMPIRYFLVIIRGIYQKGIGIEYFWDQIWPLFILGIGIFALSVLRFKKRLD
jgi:ABC-2 type transport system permease protein